LPQAGNARKRDKSAKASESQRKSGSLRLPLL
jgi:hypothetical protein